MNITFFIGNGFDLNLGLKTGYRDFLQYYLDENHDNDLTKEINSNIDKWADLETRLGIYAGSVTEDRKEAFFTEKEELDASLVRYLQSICKRKMQISPEGINEFRDSTTRFDRMITASEQEHYQRMITGSNDHIDYWFVSFNYTDFLDRICKAAEEYKPFGTHVGGGVGHQDVLHQPIHIHGTLEGNMLLGVNDKTQIGQDGCDPDPEILRFMIKPTVNESLGNLKIKRTCNIIDNSRYVCVYGMSLGETDKFWWVYIVEWLQKSTENRLILFMYEGDGQLVSGTKEARLQDRVKRRFLRIADKESLFEVLSPQINIRFNSTIFTFKNIKVEAEENG